MSLRETLIAGLLIGFTGTSSVFWLLLGSYYGFAIYAIITLLLLGGAAIRIKDIDR